MRAFADRVADRGVKVTVRHNRGTAIAIAAAYGQLASAAPDTGEMPPAVTVLVADTQQLFAEGLGMALAVAGRPSLHVVDDYPTTGVGTLAAVGRHHPDVVLFDYWMVGMNGPAATRAILASAPATKVLLLSWCHSAPHIREAVAAGATGFLPKSLRVEQVVYAIQQAQAGDPLVYGDQLMRLVDDIESRADDAEDRWQKLSGLTPRQIEILGLMGQGVPTKQMARQLGITVGTLKNHISAMLLRTGAASQLALVNMARLSGMLRDVGPPGRSS